MSEARAKLLAALSASGQVVTDLAEVMREGGTDLGHDLWSRETVNAAADTLMLVLDVAGGGEKDIRLAAALARWINEQPTWEQG